MAEPTDRMFDAAVEQAFRSALVEHEVSASQVAAADVQELLQQLAEIDRMLDTWEAYGLRVVSYSDPELGTRVRVESDIRPALFKRRRHVVSRLAVFGVGPDQPSGRDQDEEVEPGSVVFQNEALIRVQELRSERDHQATLARRVYRETRLRRWLSKEPMGVAIGAAFILMVTGAIIVGMFTHHDAPAVLTNALLLVLGYFFGQSSGRSDAERVGESSDSAGSPSS